MVDRMSEPSSLSPIKVAIVENNLKWRRELSGFLGKSRDLVLVSAVGSGEAALTDLPELKPEVVLMDIRLPNIDGVECVRRLRPLLPETQFAMLTACEDHQRLFGSLGAGASGYLLKPAAPAEVVRAIRELHAGGSPLSPKIARRLVRHFQQTQTHLDPSERTGLETLTDHQRAFLDQLVLGYRYKEIAGNLGITMHAVRGYIRRIYQKLHVHSRTEAVVKYLRR
jgi:DNA-binding NarL/FixJ family response regulator